MCDSLEMRLHQNSIDMYCISKNIIGILNEEITIEFKFIDECVEDMVQSTRHVEISIYR